MRILLESLAIGSLLVAGAALQLSGPAAPAAPAAADAAPLAPVAASRDARPSPAAAAGPATEADRPGIADAVYAAGSQYTARLDQTRNRWQLRPLDGNDVEINAGSCATGFVAPTGVWLLTVDGDGSAELIAPSATHLPAGSPDHVALRACDQASGQQLAVPRTVLALLAANTGAVYVDR